MIKCDSLRIVRPYNRVNENTLTTRSGELDLPGRQSEDKGVKSDN